MGDDAQGGSSGSWVADPLGQHELRWHDGGRLTGWVCDAGRVRHHAMASVPRRPREPRVQRFADRRAAFRRLAVGLAVLGFGVALDAAFLSMASTFGSGAVLLGAPILWGAIEITRAVRFLVVRAQPIGELEPAPTRSPGPEDEIAVIVRLRDAGRIDQRAHEMARRKIVRKYHLDVTTGIGDAHPPAGLPD